jgi:8-oxo-dGTP pyrophosphatase MutT (NUDIX family)
MIDKIKAYGICLYKKKKISYDILLCKSVLSNERYGFVKGVQKKDETKKQTAIREFYEETSMIVDEKYLEDFFIQKNSTKDIGIFLVNFNNLNDISKYFISNVLKTKYLCKENSNIEFFDINHLPKIKVKQTDIAIDIIAFFK